MERLKDRNGAVEKPGVHAYALLPSIPWLSRSWVVLLVVGVGLRIAYEWVGTYRSGSRWSAPARTALLMGGGILWAPLFFSAR